MLHKETVNPGTLELLIHLQKKNYLKGFYLVGGTALALQIGHRKSIDIDLFSDFEFDTLQILENLSADFNLNFFSQQATHSKAALTMFRLIFWHIGIHTFHPR